MYVKSIPFIIKHFSPPHRPIILVYSVLSFNADSDTVTIVMGVKYRTCDFQHLGISQKRYKTGQ